MNYALACVVTNGLFAASREKSKIRCLRFLRPEAALLTQQAIAM